MAKIITAFCSIALAAAVFTGSISALAEDDKPTPAPAATNGALVVPGALLTLIEQVEVPAREPGALAKLDAKEGQLIKRGALLAQIDDNEAQLALNKAQFEHDIADTEAKNDVKLRFARKSHEVAVADLRRAKESTDKYSRSVTQAEIDQLRLAADKADLESQQATHDMQVAQLTSKLKANEVRIAERNIQRRRIESPLDGMVVQVKRHRGEWVQPGETVVRLVRMDHLRAEGLVLASQLRGNWVGREVRFELPDRPNEIFTGKVVFITPEVNPVSGQVRIWAEIENKDLSLRPGLQGTLTIGSVK